MQGGETTTILALRPGKREMGVAVLESCPARNDLTLPVGEDLVFWGVTGFRKLDDQTIEQAVKQRVQRLIETYQPDVLAIEQVSAVRMRMSPYLGRIVRQIQTVAMEVGIRFVEVSSAQVRKQVCGSEKATQAQMVERIVEKFPHLERYYSGGRGGSGRRCLGKDDYWGPIFSAVGVAVAVSEKTMRFLPLAKAWHWRSGRFA